MSKITALIEELTKKQQKIEFLESFKKGLRNEDMSNEKEPTEEIAREVAGLLIPLIDQLIKSIEDGVSQSIPKSLSTSGTFSNSPANDSIPASVQPLPPKPHLGPSHQEELDFSMNNRHLANKQVNIVSKDGKSRMLGKVVGLKAPDSVIVKTDEGTVSTSLSSIELI